jgi:hypothetical protein
LETRNGARRTTWEINDKNSTQKQFSPLRHFTEHLIDVFGKLPRENNLDHKSSRLSIWWLNSTPGIQPATTHTQEKWHGGTVNSSTTRTAKHWSLDLLLTDSRARDENSQQHNLANKACALMAKQRLCAQAGSPSRQRT